jgi:hypothetical protein
MVIIFTVRIYYLKTRFVKGFARILQVQFCSPIEQTSRKFMSDSSMDMKEKSPYTATFKANGGFSGSPLQNDYFVVSGRLAAKGNFRQREIREQKFCRRGPEPASAGQPHSGGVVEPAARRIFPDDSKASLYRISRSRSLLRFSHCKDLLPKNAIYRWFCRDFSHAIL